MEKYLLERKENMGTPTPFRNYFLLDFEGNPIDEKNKLTDEALTAMDIDVLATNEGETTWRVVATGEKAKYLYGLFLETLEKMYELMQAGVFMPGM